MKRLFFALVCSLAAALGLAAQTTTTFNGVIKDLTQTAVATGQVTFQLRPGIDTTISGNARFVSTTLFCEIHNPSVVSTSGTGTITVVVGTSQNWQIGDSILFANTADATLNANTVATAYTITGGSGTTFTFTQSGTHTNGAGGTVGGVYASGGTGGCKVTQNTAITPANTSYNVAIWPNFSLTSSFNVYAVGSGPVDISTVTPTPGQQPAYSFFDLFSNQTVQPGATKIFAGPVSLNGGGALAGTFSGNPTLTGNIATSGNNAHSGQETFININQWRFISQFAGADLGAKMNAAVANCLATFTSCKYVIDIGGTISTAPNFPVGSYVECTATTPLVLTTTWLFSHHGTVYDFRGCKIQTSVTGPAFDIGKLAATAAVTGTVNTSGTSVTLVSGPSFNDIDLGDQIVINGAGSFNIASINPSGTSLTTVGTVGTLTGAQYTVTLNPESGISNNPTTVPVIIRDAFLQFSSGSGDAIRATEAGNLEIDAKVQGAYTTAIEFQGVITSRVRLNSTGANALSIHDFTLAGFTSGSNNNHFSGDWVIAPVSSGSCVDVKNSGANKFYQWRLEGNGCRQGVFLEGTTNGTILDHGYIERTGDGTSSSNNIAVNGGVVNTIISRTLFTDAGTGNNNGGNAIVVNGSGGPTTGTKISDNIFNGSSSSYSSAIHSLNSGTANLDTNTYLGTYSGGAVVGFPNGGIVLDTSGNISGATLISPVVTGTSSGSGVPTVTLKKGSGSGNYTSASTSYVVVDSTNLCLTVTIPTGWKLAVTASGAISTATAVAADNVALTDTASCSTNNTGLLTETTSTTTLATVLQPWALNWVIAGDGNSHNIALQFKTSNAADSVTMWNASASQVPTMVFTLTPSN